MIARPYAEGIAARHVCTRDEARERGADVVFIAWGRIADSDAWQWEGVHDNLAAAEARVGPCRIIGRMPESGDVRC